MKRLLETLTGLMCSEELAHPWTHVRRDKVVFVGDKPASRLDHTENNSKQTEYGQLLETAHRNTNGQTWSYRSWTKIDTLNLAYNNHCDYF